MKKITEQTVIVIFWSLWLLFAGIKLSRYIRIDKKISVSPANISWRIYSAENQKADIVFPDEETEKIFKKYLPRQYRLTEHIPQGKILFLNGTNGWHHLTKKILDDFYPQKNFTLILIDAHSDAAPLPKNGKINCGNWINSVGHPVIFLGGSVGLNGESNRFLNPELVARHKLQIYAAGNYSLYLKSGQNLSPGCFHKIRPDKMAKFLGSPGYYCQLHSLKDFYLKNPRPGKIYLTVDLDVLSPEYINTDFGGGVISRTELIKLLGYSFAPGEVIGADICGITEKSDQKSRDSWKIIFDYILQHLND